MEAGFPVLERVGSSDCQIAVVRCAGRRTLWIPTHHPNAYGLFHAQRKHCWSSYANAIERFVAGNLASSSISPVPRVVRATHARQVVPAAPAGVVPVPLAAGSVPRTIEEMVAAARVIRSADSFNSFIADMRRRLPGSPHPYVGVLSGMRVQQFQNWQLDKNPTWRLTDLQLLAVMRLEFPQAVGQIFTGDITTGLRQVAGIRAHYNRDGHNGPSPADRGMPPSRTYGQS
jgi:hypothetical protein